MKLMSHLFTGVLLLSITARANAAEIIDDRTVYTPDLNICVSSFGSLIQTQEIIIIPGAAGRTGLVKMLLLQWINEANDAGFYLKELDPADFYWQFVETKKYVGIILTVCGETIEPGFYETLGSGLRVPGKEKYGTCAPWNSNSDMFSFVIDKTTHRLEHFENWRFSDQESAPRWMTISAERNLVAQRPHLTR